MTYSEALSVIEPDLCPYGNNLDFAYTTIRHPGEDLLRLIMVTYHKGKLWFIEKSFHEDPQFLTPVEILNKYPVLFMDDHKFWQPGKWSDTAWDFVFPD